MAMATSTATAMSGSTQSGRQPKPVGNKKVSEVVSRGHHRHNPVQQQGRFKRQRESATASQKEKKQKQKETGRKLKSVRHRRAEVQAPCGLKRTCLRSKCHLPLAAPQRKG